MGELYSRSGETLSFLLIDTYTEQDIVMNKLLCDQLKMPTLEKPPPHSSSSPVSLGEAGTVTPTASMDRKMSPKDLSADSPSQDPYAMQQV